MQSLLCLAQVNKGLLALLLQDDFFSKPAPKSTGRERFNHSWLNNKLAEYGQKLAAEDVQATLVELTVITISDEVRQYSNGTSPELLICGGGANNPLISGEAKSAANRVDGGNHR